MVSKIYLRYLSKYCTKNPPEKISKPLLVPENCSLDLFHKFDFYSSKPITESKVELVQGKSWGLSQSLSKMKNLITERDSFVQNELDKLFQLYGKQIYHGDYFDTLKIHFNQWKTVLLGHLKGLFLNYLEQARSNLEAENLRICFNL